MQLLHYGLRAHDDHITPVMSTTHVFFPYYNRSFNVQRSLSQGRRLRFLIYDDNINSKTPIHGIVIVFSFERGVCVHVFLIRMNGDYRLLAGPDPPRTVKINENMNECRVEVPPP